VGSVTEIYVSTDVEADGPIPGPHSMLSLASAAYRADDLGVAGNPKRVLATFSANLETLPGGTPDPHTTAWWQGYPEAWQACRRDPRTPSAVMDEYLKWLKALPGRPVFVGLPASWDFMWVYWYLVRFTGERPFHEHALDVRSYAMGMRQVSFHETARSYLPKRWFDANLPHTHVALDDALEQGALFCNMLAENRQPSEE
jgi:hypothetical protein